MALAVLKLEEAEDGVVRFHADIGHNRYFRYQVGEADRRDEGGFATLADPVHESSLAGPLPGSALGRTTIEIPIDVFGRDARFVQLRSFREAPDIGTAISEIVEVPIGVLPPGLPDSPKRSSNGDDDAEGRLSRRRAAWQTAMTMTERQMQPMVRAPINVQTSTSANGHRTHPSFANGYSAESTPYAAPFTYREATYSDAMFLQALGPLLSSALPIVKKVIGGLGGAEGIGKILGSLFGGAAEAAKAPEANASGAAKAPEANASGATPQSVTPDVAAQIVELIKSIAALQSAPKQAETSAKATSLSGSRYAQQMIDPVTIAAILPAIAPLLEKVLNPETINAVLNQVGPKAQLGAVSDAIKDIGGLNIQAYQNILDHIQKNMPSSDTAPLLGHLVTVSQSLTAPSILPSYRRVESVTLQFVPQPRAMLRGREQTVYRAAAPGGVAFPIAIQTPRPIRTATLFLLVKEAETLRHVVEKHWPVANIVTGTLPETPRLLPGEMGAIRPGVDYLVCTYLVWQTRQGEPIGTSRTQLIHVAGEYSYQGVESGGDVVALNDVEKFRPFWHKVWQESFSRETRRWDWDCKYYYTTHTEGGDSERLEAVTEETPTAGRRIEGRLKSGLRASLAELNALLPQVSSYPSLNAAQLEALSAPSSLASFGRAARVKVRFRGAEGESVALWIYPEVRVQPVVLLRAGEPDANGLVATFTEEPVHFPVPAAAHFIGVTTETDPFAASGAEEEDV